MLTWKLFVNLILGWGIYDNPVFAREARHYPVWHSVLGWIAHSSTVRTSLIVGGAFVWVVAVLFANSLLFVFVPPLVILLAATGLSVGPLVLEERERLSWEPLLTTPFTLERIVLGKVGGALSHLRYLLLGMAALLFLTAAGVGFISLVLIPVGPVRMINWHEVALCGALVIYPLLGGALFVIDRVQQYLLAVVAGFAAGTSAPSVRASLSASVTAGLLSWLAEISLTELLLIMQRDQGLSFTLDHLLALVTLGPMVNFILMLPAGRVIPTMIGVLLLREVLLVGMWRWALYRAQY